ncbi:S-adenosyl-L-methionine-dependent methyltransferase [Mycena rosella]|uniref:Cytosine-specific methyltransferase n=1 Tax=Mycena rosella TaxID=1033263 RepID=A0AAD7DNW1_MYCRO|nr:S-adenosyl-L-methionine-dependent methyltransferase [Mycena rosella]
MAGRPTPYVLLTPRKRKASAPYPSPPPAASSSTTRWDSLNPSPQKKRRADQETLPVVIHLTESSVGEPEYLQEEDLGIELDDIPSDSTEKPIRKLNNFTIYRDQRLVDTIELMDGTSGHSFHASGVARARYVEDCSDEDSEDDEEDGYLVQGLQVLRIDVHHVDADGDVDKNIYIDTPRAFYILDTPSPAYRPLFDNLRIRHQFMHLIATSAVAHPKLTYTEFIDSLPYPLDGSQLQSVEIVEYFRAFLPALALDLKNTTKRNINTVPLVKTLQSRHFSKHLEIPQTVANVETLVTPIVGRVVMPYLKNAIHVIGSDLAEPDEELAEQAEILPERNPTTVRWGKSLGHPGYYSSVVIDGVEYKIGDIVSVNPGEDEDKDRTASAAVAAEFCINSYAWRVWFIKIEYFFDDETEQDSRRRPTKKLHGMWFCHGSETILQQVSHSQELFLLEACNDINVNSIFRKCDVRQLPLGVKAPLDRKDENATTYFYKWVWDGAECKTTDPPSAEEETRVRRLLPAHTPCTNCGFAEEEELHCAVHAVPNGFTKFGAEYHPLDFVYIKLVTLSASPLLVAQIEEMELRPDDQGQDTIFCRVRYFKRYETSVGFSDERRLYRSRHVNTVQARDIDGVCFVKFIEDGDTEATEAWIKEYSHVDRYYTNEKRTAGGDFITMDEDSFEICRSCVQKYNREMAELEQYRLHNEPIHSLDVFAGAGGLSEGLRRSGLIQTLWAVEISPSAAQTFKANHPETDVAETDVKTYLKYIVEREELGTGEVRTARKSPDTGMKSPDNSILPDESIPRPDCVDLLYCGSPCQSFSGANLFRKEDDVRSTLPYTFLSLAEVLHPTYVLLENVTGLLQHSLTSNGNRVTMAAVKLIYQILLALEYQVCFKVLQAGQYGTPQDRERVIFLAAKSGHQLPQHPTPTHAFFKAARRFKVPIRPGRGIRPPARSQEETHLYAAHPAVTVDDAISDLPAFDWVNLHQEIKEIPRDVAERHRRKREGIMQCTVSKSTPVGFSEPVAYATEPQTRYQKAMRGSQGGLVEHHVTRSCSTLVVESTTMVSMEPGSTHRSLPPEILPPRMKRPGNRTFYGRLDGAAHFKTAMTSPKPNGDKSCFIHPSQKRALSLREFARSQGFPDTYILCSSKKTPAERLKDYFKQIGNAVPVPLAAALGRSIGAAAVHDWKERRKRGRSVEF